MAGQNPAPPKTPWEIIVRWYFQRESNHFSVSWVVQDFFPPHYGLSLTAPISRPKKTLSPQAGCKAHLGSQRNGLQLDTQLQQGCPQIPRYKSNFLWAKWKLPLFTIKLQGQGDGWEPPRQPVPSVQQGSLLFRRKRHSTCRQLALAEPQKAVVRLHSKGKSREPCRKWIPLSV